MREKKRKKTTTTQQQTMANFNNEEVSQELEMLQSIYNDNFEMLNNDRSRIKLRILPHTCDDLVAINCFASIVFELPRDYPNEPPNVVIDNARGVDASSLRITLSELAKTLQRSPVTVFSLVFVFSSFEFLLFSVFSWFRFFFLSLDRCCSS